MSLWALIKKESRIILRSRLLLGVLVVYPLVIVAILGYAFSQPNQRVPLAVVNEDIDPATGQPNSDVITSPISGDTSTFRITTTSIVNRLREFADVQETSRARGQELLLRGEVQAVVIFPPGFVRDIANLESNGNLLIVIDQSDPVRASFMEIVIRGAVQEFQEDIVESKVDLVVEALDRSLSLRLPRNDPLYPGFRGVRDRLVEIREDNRGLTAEDANKLNESITFIETIIDTLDDSKGIVESVAQPVQLDLRQEHSGSIAARDLIVPAALGLSVFWTGTLATSSLVVYERESPAYTRLRITRATAWSIYGSKILVTLAIILGQALLILLAAILAWDTRMDNPPLTLVAILLSTFAAMGLGLFVSGIGRDVNGVVLLSVLVTFPMMFLAGLFFPVDFMPEGAQFLAKLFPLTHSVSLLRGAMLRGFTFGAGAPGAIALLLFGAGLTMLGVWLGRRQERHR